MLVYCYNEFLSPALTAAAGEAIKNSDLPILSQVVLKGEYGRLNIKSYNREMFFETNIPASISEVGQGNLPASEAAAYAASMAKEKTISLQTVGNQLKVRRGVTDESSMEFEPEPGESLFDMMDGDDFPIINGPGKSPCTIEVPSRLLKKAIQATAYAAPKDINARPAFRCVRLSIKNGFIRLAAASQVSMAMLDIPYLSVQDGENNWINKEFLLNATCMSRLASLLPDNDEINVSIGPNSNLSMVFFRYTESTFGINVTEDTPMAFEKLLERTRDYQTLVVCNRKNLVEALRQLSIFVKDEIDKSFYLTITSSGWMRLYARTPQRYETEEWVKVIEFTGINEQFEIGLSIGALLNILSNFDGVTVTFRVKTGADAVEIHPTGNNGQVCVLSPMHYLQPPQRTGISQPAA